MAIKMVLQRALEDEYMQQIHDLGVETVVVRSEEDLSYPKLATQMPISAACPRRF